MGEWVDEAVPENKSTEGRFNFCYIIYVFMKNKSPLDMTLFLFKNLNITLFKMRIKNEVKIMFFISVF